MTQSDTVKGSLSQETGMSGWKDASWFGRFKLQQFGYYWLFRDLLSGWAARIPSANVEYCLSNRLYAGLFTQGMSGAAWTVPNRVRGQQSIAGGGPMWQFPCRTEQQAFENHASGRDPFADEGIDIYVGFAWATLIDQRRKLSADHAALALAAKELGKLQVQISGLRACLDRLGLQLRVHTVCQHVYWRDLSQAWRSLGIDHVWLSHLAHGQIGQKATGLTLHPWSLYAVNVEDSRRGAGLERGKPILDRNIFASFVGAHSDEYLDDSRTRLLSLNGLDGFEIIVTGGMWHFENDVYERQIKHGDFGNTVAVRADVERYNRILSDSIFALCPSGVGPNTLRLWEALAVGCIPVLVGSMPALPHGGSLPLIDWDEIVVRIPAADIESLPSLLRKLSSDEISARQQLALSAYKLVRAQRCF